MLNSDAVIQWLGRFEIIRLCDSSSIYNNSRQQAPVRVQVLPFPGQILSDSEYASIGLVMENPDGSYEAIKENDPAAEWFLTSRRDDRFDPYLTVAYPELPESRIPPAPTDIETSLQSLPAAPEPSIRVTDRYVHCQADAGNSIRLRGVITKDSGEKFYTDSTVFDSSVTLYAQSPHSLLFPDDYYCSLSQDSLFSQASAIDEFTVAPRHTPFSFIALESQTLPQGSVETQQSELIKRNQRTASSTAHAGDEALQSFGPGVCAGGKLSARITAERPGDIVLSVNVGEDPLPGQQSGQQPSCDQLVAYDRQGNQHRISFPDETARQQASSHSFPFTVTSDAFIDNIDISNIAFFQVKGLGSSNHAAPCDVYANLYQCTYLNVVIRALRADQTPVQLTTAQLNSIVLVSYDTGQRLPNTEWYISSTPRDPDDLFDLYPTKYAEKVPETVQADQSITIWIKTKSLVNQEVAARIVLGGVTYHTYQKDVDVGGVTNSGKSNSSARIITHQQNYTIKPEQFKYTYVNYSNIGDDDIDLYMTHFNVADYRICYSPADDDIHYKGDRNYPPNIWYKEWIEQMVFRPGRKRTANFSIFSYPHFIEVNTTPGWAYAARAIVKGAAPGFEKDVGKLRTYLDQFGNSHQIWVRAERGTKGNHFEWEKAEFYRS